MIKIVLSILMLCASANAQTTPTSASYMDFSGGLNNNTAPILLPANESPDLLNVVIDEPLGALTQRKGYTLCGNVPSGNTATNLHEYNKSDGTRNLIVTDNVTIYQTPDCVQWTTIVTGLSSLFIPRFATINDKVWIVNGSTWTSTWDGTSFINLDGNDGRPQAPKGRYITNWKNRVWIASPSTDPSALLFNSLTDTDGTSIDPSISTMAWSALNTIYFGKNDGSYIYGIFPYKDNLLVWKSNSVWRLLWESEFNLNVSKTVSSIGSKFNDSIVEMDDGTLRYLGTDGIYGYNGNVPLRMSTKITPLFNSLKQPSREERFKIWDTANDFEAGVLSSLTTSYSMGSLALSYSGSTTTLFDDFRYNNITTSPIWFYTNNNALFTVPARLQFTQFYGNYATIASTISATSSYGTYSEYLNLSGYGKAPVPGTPLWNAMQHYWFFISSTTTGYNGYRVLVEPQVDVNTGIPSWYIYLQKYTNGSASNLGIGACSQKGSGIGPYQVNGKLEIVRSTAGVFTVTHPQCVTITATDNTFNFTSGFVIENMECVGTNNDSGMPYGSVDDIYMALGFASTGTWTSQVSTATGLSAWGTFDADETLNGQTIDYLIRTASTTYNLGLKSYRTITPGAIISTNTAEIYAQVISSFSTSNIGTTPLLNRLALNWITGDISLSSIKGIKYKSRYWLAASSIPANSYNDTVIVESKPPLGSHTVFNIPLSAMVLWNNNLYGSISNTPKIVRLDYGNTDDGEAITSFWSSKDEIYQAPIFYKSINKGILDFFGLQSTVSLSLSPDAGTTWQTRNINITAGPRSTKILNFDANMSQAFRLKISHSLLGANYLIYGLHSLGTMTQFMGN